MPLRYSTLLPTCVVTPWLWSDMPVDIICTVHALCPNLLYPTFYPQAIYRVYDARKRASALSTTRIAIGFRNKRYRTEMRMRSLDQVYAAVRPLRARATSKLKSGNCRISGSKRKKLWKSSHRP